MIFPRIVKEAAVSTTTRPVTHTALKEVNKESRYDKGIVCALGSINKPEPIKIIIKKPDEKIKAGGIFFELMNLSNPDNSETARRKIAITIWVFPKKNAHKRLSVFTIWKLESKTPEENRNTIIQYINEIKVFLLFCRISGINLEKNRINNNILKVDSSTADFFSELLKPI